MDTYVMLTRLHRGQATNPASMEKTEKEVMKLIRENCSDVRWQQSLAVAGPWDYLDIFEAPDNDKAMEVSTLIRSYAGADTEIWPASSWAHFKDLIHDLPQVA
jgi:uncharacterized protein with GYD domain